MRTFCEGLRTLVEKATDSACNERRYDVTGWITFVYFSHHGLPTASDLRRAILEVDALFPWRDDVRPGEEYRSIRYLSDGEISEQAWSTPETDYWFAIHPWWKCLKRGQIRAYEKYLEKLAEELAKCFPAAKEVRGVIHITSVVASFPKF